MYGSETRTLRKRHPEMFVNVVLEKELSGMDTVRNEVVLRRVNKKRSILTIAFK